MKRQKEITKEREIEKRTKEITKVRKKEGKKKERKKERKETRIKRKLMCKMFCETKKRSFKDFDQMFLFHGSIILGALKRGPCTCSTFKAFNLIYLHVLRS